MLSVQPMTTLESAFGSRTARKVPDMSKYIDLAKVGTVYARRMKHLSNRIFGEVTRETNSKSMKVVKMYSEKPTYMRPGVINYYPRHVETNDLMRHLRYYGLFRDEHQDFKEEMARQRVLRGKPPKGRDKRKNKPES